MPTPDDEPLREELQQFADAVIPANDELFASMQRFQSQIDQQIADKTDSIMTAVYIEFITAEIMREHGSDAGKHPDAMLIACPQGVQDLDVRAALVKHLVDMLTQGYRMPQMAALVSEAWIAQVPTDADGNPQADFRPADSPDRKTCILVCGLNMRGVSLQTSMLVDHDDDKNIIATKWRPIEQNDANDLLRMFFYQYAKKLHERAEEIRDW